MYNFIIDIYDNQNNIYNKNGKRLKDIIFEGDFPTLKKYIMTLVKIYKLSDCQVYIYDTPTDTTMGDDDLIENNNLRGECLSVLKIPHLDDLWDTILN